MIKVYRVLRLVRLEKAALWRAVNLLLLKSLVGGWIEARESEWMMDGLKKDGWMDGSKRGE